MAAFGVHFGTCSACLAVYKDGRTDVVANDLGDRVTPCVVAFTEHDSTVGAAAKQGVIRNAQNTVCHVKRILGRSFDDSVTQEFITSCPVKVVSQNNQPIFDVQFKEKRKQFSPDTISEMVYRKMLEIAQSHSSNGAMKAVLAVPIDFSVEQRNAASMAARKAGFSVLRLINESSAAALAYDLGQLDNTEKFKVLVYRLGGTSHDATVLQVQNGMYRVLGSCMDHTFGADNFTHLLQQHFTAEFQRGDFRMFRHQATCPKIYIDETERSLVTCFKEQLAHIKRNCSIIQFSMPGLYKSDPQENRRSMAKLLLNAEGCKHTLSKLDNAQCAVDSLLDGIDFHTSISRARFESLCSGAVGQCTQLIQQALAKANCAADDISKVVMCGGGTKMTLVQRSVSDFLLSSELLNSLPGDEVIAIGAAKEAAILAGKECDELDSAENENVFCCLSRDIGIETTKGLEVVLASGTVIPFRTHHVVTLAPEQTSFRMVISETGDAENSTASRKLAKLVMKNLPAGSSIKTSFHLKREGGLHVTSHEVSSGQQESVHLSVSNEVLQQS